MKYFLFFLLSVFCFSNANAQYSRVIVQLKDKSNNAFSLSNPSLYLSAKALQRRTKYNIPVDSTDLPASQSYINTLSQISNVTVLSVSKWLNRVLVQTTDPNAIIAIQSLPFVAEIINVAPRSGIVTGQHNKFKEEITPLKPQARTTQTASNVYNYGSNYNQVHIHEGEFLHNKGFNGSAMQITVLDAGFRQYKTITAFDSLRMNGQVLGEMDFVDFDSSTNEDDSHGMYCLSTMAANWPGKMVGTAPKANYWLVRTENAPNEYPVEEHNWVVGAEFADSTGSDLLSSSLGYNTFDDNAFDHTYSELYKNVATVSQGAALAVKKGMIVMNSAGNEGTNSWKYIVFPADGDSVCAVGAVNDQGIIGSFSSRGYVGKVKPNIASVGVNAVIAGTNNQPSSGNGTSFANPNVAGLVACLWQAFPALSNMQILQAVYKSANRYTRPDSAYGYGIPNFRTAYHLIKHDQNVAIYGNEWLWATPNPFDKKIDVKFIAQADGIAALYLKDPAGVTLSKQTISIEQEEIYNYTFDKLSGLPGGDYTIKYADTDTSRRVTLYKNEWLWATPDTFDTRIDIQLIGRINGTATLSLVNSQGQVIAVQSINTQESTTYNYVFNSLSEMQGGSYKILYTDDTISRSIGLYKRMNFDKDWLIVSPNPFRNNLTINIKAPDAGSLTLRLLNAAGATVKQMNAVMILNEERTFSFNTIHSIPAGVYFLQYLSGNRKRLVKVVKN